MVEITPKTSVVGFLLFVVVASLVQTAGSCHAYRFGSWLLLDRGWRLRMKKAKCSSYWSHLFQKAHFAMQLLIAGTAGFTHAFIASLVPFVAEEVGSQLFALVSARRKRGGAPDFSAEGTPYAYQPRRWVIYVDPIAHVNFSGGSYTNHGRFACWASGQFIIGGLCGLIHAIFPPMLPLVAEEVSLELGGLIVNRRKLRNKQEGFKNPDNLSDFFTKDWESKFNAAAKLAAKDGSVGNSADGDGELARAKIKVKVGPKQEAKFL